MRDSMARNAVSAWMLWAALWGAGLSSSCFDPSYPADRPCGADGWCPPGQGCIDNVCRLPGYVPPSIDARVEPPDAETPMVDPTEAGLEVLAPSAGALAPAFDREVTEYTLQVSGLVQAVLWEARAVHPEARVRIDDVEVMRGQLSTPTPVGDTGATVEIVVMAPSGNSRTYTVTITNTASVAQKLYVKPYSVRLADTFGWSVAVSGDTLAVGASLEDTGGQDSGAVYVFRRMGASWVQDAMLKASTPSAFHEFGLHVALDGDTLAVGEPGNASVTASPGSIHVFRRSGSTWSLEQRIAAEMPRIDSELGIRLALSGDTLVAGAHLESEGGSAYVFRRAGTTWTQEARLQASNLDLDDGFGYSVAIDGDVIVVGARHEDSADTGVNGDDSDDAAADSGAAYVFRRSGGSWSQEAYLKASDTGAGDRFGFRVAVSGDLVVVGAPCEDEENAAPAGGGDPVCKETVPGDSAIRNSGAAYVFGHDGQGWSQRARLKASNLEDYAHFGHGVAVRGKLVAVGSPDEDGGVSGSGAVYLFECAATCGTPARLNAAQPDDSDAFGFSVDLSVDGLVVGAPYEDSGSAGVGGDPADDSVTDSGAAYLFQ
jgi:hypothetical protein